MEYDKGKISASGREVSQLNHPCYLGYKAEVGYKLYIMYNHFVLCTCVISKYGLIHSRACTLCIYCLNGIVWDSVIMFLSRGELSREVDELMIKLRDTEKYGYNSYHNRYNVGVSLLVWASVLHHLHVHVHVHVDVLVNVPVRVFYRNYWVRGSSRRSCSTRRSWVLHELRELSRAQ